MTSTLLRAADLCVGRRSLFPLLAQLPMGMEIMAPPLDEPILIRIAAAFDAATRPRRPPLDFGPMEGEP